MKTTLTAKAKPNKDLHLVEPRPVRVALAGQPNAGKTVLFNRLTGSRSNVANYPGVTVERRQGSYRHAERTFEVLDLPGIYSLSSFSPEERVAQDELLGAPPDVVVAVVDSTTLNRSLILLAQLMLIQRNLILCLNMTDEARRAGLRIDTARMGRLLGMPIVETIGHRGTGVAALSRAIAAAADEASEEPKLVLGEPLDPVLADLAALVQAAAIPAGQSRWFALKALMGDGYATALLAGAGPRGTAALAAAADARIRLEAATGRDIALVVSQALAGFVDGLLDEVTLRNPRPDARARSDKLDAVLAHRWLGLPVFGGVMYLLFWMTFSVGTLPMEWLEGAFGALGGWVAGLWPAGSESALRSLLVDGIIGGVGGVLVFLPNILLLFFGLALLEDTGYMARAAHLVDNAMHRFGLHGKSFLPLVTGFGCSIPGIMAARTLENERDRLITILVLPLMSCGARLPIWLLLVPAFFPATWQAPALWLIYALGIGLALLLALALRKTLFAGQEAPFVMELPPYRAPTLGAIAAKMRERAWLYVRKAGTIILAISVLMWFISAYPKADSTEIDRRIAAGQVVVSQDPAAVVPAGVEVLSPGQADKRRAAQALEHSLAGRLGRTLATIFEPLGFDWRLSTALVGAFAAKEVFVAQMGIVTSLGGDESNAAGLRETLARDYSPLTAICLIIFLLVGTPCMATVAITRREAGGWKWALFQFGGLTAVAYALSLLTYQVGRLFA